LGWNCFNPAIAYRKDIYNQWQALMIDEAPVIPTLYRSVIIAVNNRVKNFSVDPNSKLTLKDVAVTAAQPMKE
jgi:peptide/nickel transport system substrate-binding protein